MDPAWGMDDFWLPHGIEYQCLTWITYEALQFYHAKVLANTIGCMVTAVFDQVLKLLTSILSNVMLYQINVGNDKKLNNKITDIGNY